MEHWLLISNCQTFALADSFRLLCPSVEIEAVDMGAYSANADRINLEMDRYDRVVVNPHARGLPGYDSSRARRIGFLPALEFWAYHPDFAYFWRDEQFVSGMLGAYQPILAAAAYNLGMSAADARALYNAATYEACGYFGNWSVDRDATIATFAAHDLDIAADFLRWSRGQAFMYTMNHPRIEPIYEVARLFLRSQGMEIVESGLRPPDDLVRGVCLPVYDELAEQLSIAGSYRFKLPAAYSFATLDQVIDASFATFEAYPRGGFEPHPHYRARYDATVAALEGRA